MEENMNIIIVLEEDIITKEKTILCVFKDEDKADKYIKATKPFYKNNLIKERWRIR